MLAGMLWDLGSPSYSMPPGSPGLSAGRQCKPVRWATSLQVNHHSDLGEAISVGIFDATGKLRLRKLQSRIASTAPTKKGWLKLNHPLMDAASKMPCYFFAQQKKCTNIPEVVRYPNAMFLDVQGCMEIFTIKKGQPFIHDCP
jgi:hypothetical protein